MPSIATIPRKTTKGPEARLRALAASKARNDVCAHLEGRSPAEKARITDAQLDAWLTAHAATHGPEVTSPKVCGWAGKNHPDVDRKTAAADQFNALFKTERAA